MLPRLGQTERHCQTSSVTLSANPLARYRLTKMTSLTTKLSCWTLSRHCCDPRAPCPCPCDTPACRQRTWTLPACWLQSVCVVLSGKRLHLPLVAGGDQSGRAEPAINTIPSSAGFLSRRELADAPPHANQVASHRSRRSEALQSLQLPPTRPVWAARAV